MHLLVPPTELFSKKGLQWLEELLQTQTLEPEAELMIRSDLRLLQSLQQEIDRFEQRLAREAYNRRQARLLMTLPGVDLTVALGFLAAVGDIRRFNTPEQVASYLGLTPSTRQSAQKCYHGPITKRGNSQARWLLIQAAQHLGRHPGPLGHFFRRMKKRKNHNVAVVATARKMAMIATLMLRAEEPYRYALPRSTETKLASLRVRATGCRRRGGVPKGSRPTAKLPGGSRTIKSLDRIYAQEGLPARRPLAAGEQAMLERTDSAAFARSLDRERIVPRKNASKATAVS